MNDNIPEIDMFYTEQFDKLECYYKCKLEYIKVIYVYMDNTNSINAVLEENRFVNNNTISDKELVYLIKKHLKNGEKTYKFHSMFTYNNDLDSDEALESIDDDIILSTNDKIREMTTLESVTFNDSIMYFHDLNSLYLLFNNPVKTQSKRVKNNETRRIQIT